jgi:glycosyltransferase involved in cell wall biosynthesis
MPNAVLEAMAAGKPVVASDVEGVRELLGPGGDAQAAPAGDADGFLLRLMALLSDPQKAVAWGAENRRRVRDKFSLPTMVQRYELLYTSLLYNDPLAESGENF